MEDNKITTLEELVSLLTTLQKDIHKCADLSNSLAAEAAASLEDNTSWVAYLEGEAKAYEVVAKKLDTIIDGCHEGILKRIAAYDSKFHKFEE